MKIRLIPTKPRRQKVPFIGQIYRDNTHTDVHVGKKSRIIPVSILNSH